MFPTKKRRNVFLVTLTGIMLTVIFLAFVSDDFKKFKEINTTGNLLACDPLGNAYVADEYELKKIDPAGKVLHTYSNFIAGNISHVDPSDPFKVLVYYKEFGQIDILDNMLSPTSDPILLQSYGYELASLVCRSYNSGIWIYDPTNFELVRFDQNMLLSERTGNINQLTGYQIDPNYLLESDNNLYLNDPQTGILVFDRYGTYFKTFPFTGITSFQVQDERIIYFTGTKLVIYDTRKLLSSEIETGAGGLLDAKVSLDLEPHQLYLLGSNKLHILRKNN